MKREIRRSIKETSLGGATRLRPPGNLWQEVSSEGPRSPGWRPQADQSVERRVIVRMRRRMLWRRQWRRRFDSARSQSRGFALLELAAWCVVALPVALVGADVLGMSHDRNITQTVAAETVRETVGHALSWHSDGYVGLYQVDYNALQAAVDRMAERALSELDHGAMFLVNSSVLACYWVVSVDPVSGLAESDEAMGCAERGPRSDALSLVDYRREISADRVGTPNPVSLGGEYFAPKSVLIGVNVGGHFRGVSSLLRSDLISTGVIRLLREEISL